MKRIALIGVAGPNLGDTAIAQAICEASERLGCEVTLVHPGKVSRPLPRFPQLIFSRRRIGDWRALRALMRRSDDVWIGGGSLIQDRLGTSPVRGMLPFVFQVALLACASGRRPTLMCVGVDRLYTRLGKRMASLVLRRLTSRIVVRDPQSFRRARVLAGGAARIRLCPDPAFVLRIVADTAQDADVILVPSRHDMKWQDAAELFAQLLDYIKVPRSSIDMVLSDTSAPERDYADEVARALERRGFPVRCHVPQTLDALLERLAAAPLLLSMRLHPVILAFSDRNCVIVSDNSKLTSLARELGLPRISPAKWFAGDRLAFDSGALEEAAGAARSRLREARAADFAQALEQLQ